MAKRGRKRAKKNQNQAERHPSETSGRAGDSTDEKIPKSLVIRRGKTAPEVGDLVQDLRQLMMPYTAKNFQEDPKNRKLTLRQYATNLALPMGITHIMALAQNEERLHLRLARTPEGPTLHFRIHKFSLSKHIKSLQRRPVSISTPGLQSHPPVVVTNNFGSSGKDAELPHVKLMRISFQNLFPAINVATVRLADCRRVVLFNLVEEEVEGEKKSLVQLRHYAIRATPVGVNRKVRRLVHAQKLPNLNKVADIADYLEGPGALSDASDSEAEDEKAIVQLADRYTGRGNLKSQKSALKLVELGPRLSMELIKVEKELGGGDILYHALVKKTPEEAAALKVRKEEEAALKEERRQTQAANVERKRRAAEEKRETKRQRKEQRKTAAMNALRSGRTVETGISDDDSSHEEEELE